MTDLSEEFNVCLIKVGNAVHLVLVNDKSRTQLQLDENASRVVHDRIRTGDLMMTLSVIT